MLDFFLTQELIPHISKRLQCFSYFFAFFVTQYKVELYEQKNIDKI